MKIRQPIICTLGHVDHGKTLLLDAIRGTRVQAKEPGAITQHIGASYIPSDIIKEICGDLLKKFKIEIKVPGLLFIDTPGHKSFTSLRKRGGSIADLSILVIDINEGFQIQTHESLQLLKQFKVPFVIAATKIDKISNWKKFQKSSFSESFEKQDENTRNELERKIYEIVSELSENGFDSERFDKVKDFKKKIAIVPCSGLTGEGIPELLLVLCGLAQQFLKEKLKLSEKGRGNVLEVKEVKGLGTTIDVILHDGYVERENYIVIGGKEPIVTKIKALLIPRPLQELRVEKKFMRVKRVDAAAGVKIVGKGFENVIGGSPFIICKSEKEIEEAKKELKKEIEILEFKKETNGIIIKADTIGSLEALIKLAEESKIPIRKAEVGNITNEDVIEASLVEEKEKRAIFSFNVKTLQEAEEKAREMQIKIFQSNVIYRILEDYEKWCKELREKEIIEKLEKVGRPVKLKVLRGCIFRSSNPCIVGVEIIAGKLIPGISLEKNSKFIGKVKEIQTEGKTIQEANVGDKVAISMEEPIAKKDFFEEDILTSILKKEEIEILEEFKERLSFSEVELLKEIKNKLKI